MKYTTINIQGNLLSEEILNKIETGDAQGQLATDFGFEPGTNLRSEIEYAWSRIKLDWRHFSEKAQKLSSNDIYGTTLTRRWMEQCFSSLGFAHTRQRSNLMGENNQGYSISHTADNVDGLPLHIVGFFDPERPEKNTLDIRSSGGTSRLSPHATVQEYLNVTEHLFGIATNGMVLRLIRDSGRLIKLTYVEFDLKRMLDEDKYSEFTLLYRLLHASRFPRSKAEAGQCLLEKYYQDSIETGNRIRDGLSSAVKESLLALGNGFLQHPDNVELREKLINGELTTKNYYRQLLRIIYRFLFLMVTEERDLIYDQEDKTEATQRLKKIYLQYYSIARLRKLSARRYVYETQFNDLWQGLVQTFQLFEAGGRGKKLGIMPLDGDLFSDRAIEDVMECMISNKLLLECVRNMNEFRDDQRNLVSINYRSLDVEELGSVYEGLLDLHPVIEHLDSITPSHIQFSFHEGTDRKTTGSYYTRPELVNELIKSALIPVVEDRLKEHHGDETAQARALLKLKVCDAAAGSGHMLLAAARTIAWYLARVQSGEDNPAPSVYRQCLREVIQHCIYAVDYNPDAVELCKLALWLEGHNSGKPLSFLDHKIRNGNSLVGVTDLSVLKKGIPDDAFAPVTGDDRAICTAMKRVNTQYLRTRQQSLDFGDNSGKNNSEYVGDYKELEGLRQDTIDGVRQAKDKFDTLRNNQAWFKEWRACNLWTAAFFWHYTDENKQAAPTSERLASFLDRPGAAYGPMIGMADALSMEHKFFHWPLEFPDVFEQGGFDVMLGNPPWEAMQVEEKQFFAGKNNAIAIAENKSMRESLIEKLAISDPELYKSFYSAKHAQDCVNKFVRDSGRFPNTSYGKLNTDALFSELFTLQTSKLGRCSFIIPTGVITDKSTKNYFIKIINEHKLVSFIGFINSKKIFRTVKDYIQFGIITISEKHQIPSFMFLLKEIVDIHDAKRRFTLSFNDLLLVNPNTQTCPIFRTHIDANLCMKMYKQYPVIENQNTKINSWKIAFKQGLFNMSSASRHFKKQPGTNLIPVYEAKLFHQFEHRYTTYEGATASNINEGNLPLFKNAPDPQKTILPYYWISEDYVFNESLQENFRRKWYLCFRDVTGANSERTAIFSIVPKSGIGNKSPIVIQQTQNETSYCLLLANFNSLAFDYITKQKLSGASLNFYVVKQLPIVGYNDYSIENKFKIKCKVLELVYTSWDIKAFADDIWKEADAELRAAIRQQWEENKAATGGHEWDPPEWCEIDPEGCPLPPFKWDENRRAVLKAELDAIYAKLYGLNTDELRYILDPQDVYGPDFPGETFRVLKEKDIRLYGEYRTKRLVLEAWERLGYGVI